jgi:hypothetical protein
MRFTLLSRRPARPRSLVWFGALCGILIDGCVSVQAVGMGGSAVAQNGSPSVASAPPAPVTSMTEQPVDVLRIRVKAFGSMVRHRGDLEEVERALDRARSDAQTIAILAENIASQSAARDRANALIVAGRAFDFMADFEARAFDLIDTAAPSGRAVARRSTFAQAERASRTEAIRRYARAVWVAHQGGTLADQIDFAVARLSDPLYQDIVAEAMSRQSDFVYTPGVFEAWFPPL